MSRLFIANGPCGLVHVLITCPFVFSNVHVHCMGASMYIYCSSVVELCTPTFSTVDCVIDTINQLSSTADSADPADLLTNLKSALVDVGPIEDSSSSRYQVCGSSLEWTGCSEQYLQLCPCTLYMYNTCTARMLIL